MLDFPETGFRRLIGVRILEIRPDFARIGVEVTGDLLNPAGACHGGAVGAILDSAMGNALDGAIVQGDIEQFSVTVECKINYLAAIPVGPVTASARVLSRNGDLATVEAELYRSDGRLAAIGLATFMITRPGIAQSGAARQGR